MQRGSYHQANYCPMLELTLERKHFNVLGVQGFSVTRVVLKDIGELTSYISRLDALNVEECLVKQVVFKSHDYPHRRKAFLLPSM